MQVGAVGTSLDGLNALVTCSTQQKLTHESSSVEKYLAELEEEYNGFSIKIFSLRWINQTTIKDPAYIAALTRFLFSRRETVHAIELENCLFTPVTWQFFVQIFQMMPYLNALSFKRCSLSKDYLEQFVCFSGRLHDNLRKFEIFYQNLEDSSLQVLESFLKKCTYLEHLVFYHCDLNDQRLATIFPVLRSMYRLKTLNLAYNHLTDVGAMHIAFVYMQERRALEAIILNHNRVSTFGFMALTCMDVQYLYLTHNAITDQAMDSIADRLGGIRTISLKNNHLTNFNAFEFFKRMPSLVVLNLAGNPIGETEREKIVRAHIDVSYLQGRACRVCVSDFKEESKVSLDQKFKGTLTFEHVDNPHFIKQIKETLQAKSLPIQDVLNQIRQIKHEELKEQLFAKLLKRFFTIQRVPGDGDCLFSSVIVCCEELEEICPPEEDFVQWLRQQTSQIIKLRPAEFQSFLADDEAENLDSYVTKMKASRAWGGEQELLALSKVLEHLQIERSIHVFDGSPKHVMLR